MKKLENAKKLIIHDGTFHADDVMCAAIMRKLNPDIIIERVSEVPEYVESDTVIADIGGGEFDECPPHAPYFSEELGGPFSCCKQYICCDIA